MEKNRSSPLSFLFPWLSPLVLKFALVNGGIEVQLYRNNRLLKNWHASKLRDVLPEPLTKWIDDNHIYMGPQPYPLIKQLWQYLIPLASKKLIIDSSVLAELEEISQPQDFALVWVLNHSLARIEGRYEGADHYLGMGWFQKGTKIWSLNNHPSNATDSQLKNPIVPIQQANFLLNSIIPYLQHYLPTRADFQFITNFALQVIVLDARSRGLILALQSNYPQFLPTIQVPQQKVDVLLANQAIIQFPHQALTPVMIQLLQSGSSTTIQGAGVPLFISEQLPIMRHYRQISDDMVAKITQSNPIVSIATLRPTLSLIHLYENGVGKYTTTATYQYQQHTLDMDALLAARQQNQHFVQQHAVWFEWPYNSNGLVNTIQQQRAPQVLLPEEVMGFDTRRVALLHKQPSAYTIQPGGTTPVERGQSVFAQLRHHGIPGGIVGEPGGLVTMFVNACEHLLRDNRQARILWLVPSHKKGSVTRVINGSTINSYVTVASLVTLRDEPALISRSWTLVIFQGLDQLLNGSAQPRMLSQLTWKWALTSVTSKRALSPLIMQVLHLPEQYHGHFCARYLFDPLQTYKSAAIGQHTSDLNTVQPTVPIAPKQEADRIPQTLSQKPVEPVLPKIEISRPKVLEPILATKPSVQLSNPIDESEQETQKIVSLTIQGKIVQKARESLIHTLHSHTLHSMIQLNLETEPAALPPATHTPAQSEPESVRANQVVLPPNTYAPVKPAFNAVRPNPAPLQPTIHIPARPAPENIRPKLAPSPVHRSIELNQKKIARLHEESEQLQERLIVEDGEQSPSLSMPASPVPPVHANPPVKQESEQQTIQQILEPTEQIREEPATPPRSRPLSSVNARASEKDRTEEVAAQASLPGKKAERTTPSSRISPIEQRVAVMKQYWHHFDEIHARQAEEMKPLWGLVEDSRAFDFEHRFRSHDPYQFQLYRQLLPSVLLAEIEQLWGTTMLPRWPERIISEPFPHILFAETFGPALKFWHGCALTAWFICEGPSSRTDLAGLTEYYYRDVQALKEMGAPINERLFEELAKAEAQLGQPQPFTRQMATSQENFGITITTSTSYGTRRKGFEKLRDIISFHRQQWAERYLDQYLQRRWETEIREAAHSYELYINEKGIPPTAKKFAKDAKIATNHWFGGNIGDLYRAIQEQSPIQPQRVTILPADRTALAFTVFKKLSVPENHSSEQKSLKISQQSSQTEKLTNSQYYQLNRLAALSFWYVQLEEALGCTPTLSDFGSSTFAQYSRALNIDINKAWDIFSSVIEAAKWKLPAPVVTPGLIKTKPDSAKPTSRAKREPVKNTLDSVEPTSAQRTQPTGQANLRGLSKLQEEFERLSAKRASSPMIQPTVQPNPKSLSKLQEEFERLSARPTPAPPIRPAVQLNLEAISKLQEESAHLQERLTFETEEDQPEQPGSMSEPGAAPATPVVREATEPGPDVDEDWQIILQQWQPEHWEIISLLCQEKSVQLTTAERKDHRPVSLLIDEINSPVDEQLGDLLIDPDAHTISPHLHAIAERLVRWYFSSKDR